MVAPGTVEDENDVIAVVVELRTLAELLAVFQRQGVKAEQLAELRKLVMAGRCEVEPEEMVPSDVIDDLRFVDRGEARHHKPKLLARALPRRRSCLPDGHVEIGRASCRERVEVIAL